jgi:O-antigen ligase
MNAHRSTANLDTPLTESSFQGRWIGSHANSGEQGALEFAVFLAALAALFVPLPRLGLPVSPENAVYAVGVLLLLGLGSLGGLRVGRLTLQLAVLALVFFGLQAVAKRLAGDEALLQFNLLRRAMFLLFCVVSVNSPGRLRAACAVLVVLVSLNALVGLLNVLDVGLVSRPFATYLSLLDHEDGDADETLELASNRLVGFGGSIFGFSYLGTPALLLAVAMILEGLPSPQRRPAIVGLAVAASLLVIAVLFNAERSALVAFAAGGLYLATGLSPGQRRLLGLVTLVAAAGLGCMALRNEMLLPGQEDQSHSLVHRLTTEVEGEFGARIGQAQAGVLTVLENPLSGGTWDDYQRIASSLPSICAFAGHRSDVPAPHNAYINAGVRAGIPGWLLMGIAALLLVRVLRLARRTATAPGSVRVLSLGAGAALTGALVNALFHNAGLFSGEPMTWATLALCCAAIRLGPGGQPEPAPHVTTGNPSPP